MAKEKALRKYNVMLTQGVGLPTASLAMRRPIVARNFSTSVVVAVRLLLFYRCWAYLQWIWWPEGLQWADRDEDVSPDNKHKSRIRICSQSGEDNADWHDGGDIVLASLTVPCCNSVREGRRCGHESCTPRRCDLLILVESHRQFRKRVQEMCCGDGTFYEIKRENRYLPWTTTACTGLRCLS